MKYYDVTFRSVTYAQRAERLMQRGGIRCSLRRAPRWMEEQGCGYALRIWTEDIRTVTALLRREGLPIGRVYAQQLGGEMEVVEL